MVRFRARFERTDVCADDRGYLAAIAEQARRVMAAAEAKYRVDGGAPPVAWRCSSPPSRSSKRIASGSIPDVDKDVLIITLLIQFSR
jgi:hypothetical protein